MQGMDGEFARLYSPLGRTSIAPEPLLRASLLQESYAVHLEQQLCDQIEFNLPHRRFIGLLIDEAVWDHSAFSQNRERLFNEEVARQLFDQVNALAQ